MVLVRLTPGVASSSLGHAVTVAVAPISIGFSRGRVKTITSIKAKAWNPPTGGSSRKDLEAPRLTALYMRTDRGCTPCCTPRVDWNISCLAVAGVLCYSHSSTSTL